MVGDCTEELRQFTELTNSAPPPRGNFYHLCNLHTFSSFTRMAMLSAHAVNTMDFGTLPPQRMLGLILLHIILKVNGKIVQIFTKTFVKKYKFLLSQWQTDILSNSSSLLYFGVSDNGMETKKRSHEISHSYAVFLLCYFFFLMLISLTIIGLSTKFRHTS